MQHTKIRLPTSDLGDRAFMELVRKHGLRGTREHGETVYLVSAHALAMLDSLELPYEVLESDRSIAQESPDSN